MKLSDKTEDKVEIPAEVKEVGKKYDKIILTIKRVRYIPIVIVVILMFFHNETGDNQKIFENNIFFICLIAFIVLCIHLLRQDNDSMLRKLSLL